MRIIWHEEENDREREGKHRGRGRIRRLLLRVLIGAVLVIAAIYAYFLFYQPPEDYEQKWTMPSYGDLGGNSVRISSDLPS